MRGLRAATFLFIANLWFTPICENDRVCLICLRADAAHLRVT